MKPRSQSESRTQTRVIVGIQWAPVSCTCSLGISSSRPLALATVTPSRHPGTQHLHLACLRPIVVQDKPQPIPTLAIHSFLLPCAEQGRHQANSLDDGACSIKVSVHNALPPAKVHLSDRPCQDSFGPESRHSCSCGRGRGEERQAEETIPSKRHGPRN
jgi:hypothetical protein